MADICCNVTGVASGGKEYIFWQVLPTFIALTLSHAMLFVSCIGTIIVGNPLSVVIQLGLGFAAHAERWKKPGAPQLPELHNVHLSGLAKASNTNGGS